MLRSWGGIMDMSMDGSPIIDTHADRRALSQCRLVLRRLQGDAGLRLVLRPPDRHATSRTRSTAAFRLDRFATGPSDRRKGPGRPAQSALRTPARCASPVPIAASATSHEFTYLGDATLVRPEPAASPNAERCARLCLSARQPRGPHREILVSRAGCRSWLVVTRDTATHADCVRRRRARARRGRRG